MTTYYVNKDGNDSGDGLSHATGWLSLDKALGINGVPLTGGPHTVLVGDGTYASAIKLSLLRAYSALVTVQPETAGGSVIIIGASGGTNIQLNGGATNLKFKNITLGGYSGSTYTLMVYANASISGISFENCTITDDGVTADAYLVADSFSGTGTVEVSFIDCVFTGRTAGVHTHLDLRSTSTMIATFTLTRCTINSAKTGTQWAVQGEGSVLYMTGCNLNSTGRGLAFGADNTTGLATGGYVRGCSFTCSGNHGLLLGGGSASIEVSGNTFHVGGHCIIDKGSGNTATGNYVESVTGSSNAAILLKGSTNFTVTNNTILCYAGNHAIANYDGVTLNTSGAKIKYNALKVLDTARGIYWEAVNNGTGNVIDYNLYTAGSSVYHWGRILTNNCTTLALLKSAWAGYGDGSNESHSNIYIPRKFLKLRGKLLVIGGRTSLGS